MRKGSVIARSLAVAALKLHGLTVGSPIWSLPVGRRLCLCEGRLVVGGCAHLHTLRIHGLTHHRMGDHTHLLTWILAVHVLARWYRLHRLRLHNLAALHHIAT